MKKQILLNSIRGGGQICPTIKANYWKMGVVNFVCHTDNTDGFAAPCVLEIEDMQKLINADSNGISRTIVAQYGAKGYKCLFRNDGFGITGVMEEIEPKIAASRGSGEFNQQHLEINDSGTSNTITSVNKDNLLIEPKINLVGQYDSSQNSRVIGTDGVSYCMANGHKDGMPKIIEPNVLRAERTEQCKQLIKMNGDKGIKFNGGNKMFAPRTDGMANTLTSSVKDNMLAVPELRMEDGCLVDKDGKRYRIRKLTPRECFRLMDVKDKDIDKIQQAGIAKTNQYKLAGNSIVVSPMYHIFRKLFVEKENENQQLELF